MILGSFWRKFTNLLPQEPVRVATIESKLGGGEYIVVLLGGGYLKVKGSEEYATQDKVFIRAGVIQSKSTNLPEIIIDV